MFDYTSFIIFYIGTTTGFNHSHINHIFVKNNNVIENFKAGVNQNKILTILSILVLKRNTKYKTKC